MPATLWRGPYEREAGTPGKREGACSHDHSRGKASDEWSLGCPLLLDFVGFTQAELQSFRNASVPDLVGPELKLLFVGINPGLWTAATQTHFAHPGNRFYPALVAAGILPTLPDFVSGFTPGDRAALIARGLGISNLVNRAT